MTGVEFVLILFAAAIGAVLSLVAAAAFVVIRKRRAPS